VRAALATSLALAALTFAPSRARAYEDQAGVSLAAGYAVITSPSPPLPQHGLALQAAGSFGLGDTFELRVLGAWAMHFDAAPLHRVSLGVEIVYLIDVFVLVPFVGLGVDVPISIHDRPGGASVRADFAGHLVVGLDWVLTREWTIGLEFRPYVSFTSLPNDPVWLTVLLRGQLLFEI
jgi:hypothetical protein